MAVYSAASTDRKLCHVSDMATGLGDWQALGYMRCAIPLEPMERGQIYDVGDVPVEHLWLPRMPYRSAQDVIRLSVGKPSDLGERHSVWHPGTRRIVEIYNGIGNVVFSFADVSFLEEDEIKAQNGWIQHGHDGHLATPPYLTIGHSAIRRYVAPKVTDNRPFDNASMRAHLDYLFQQGFPVPTVRFETEDGKPICIGTLVSDTFDIGKVSFDSRRQPIIRPNPDYYEPGAY